MSRRPIDPDVDPAPEPSRAGRGVAPEAFREALSHWASTVTVVAVRDPAPAGHPWEVHGVTATSFMPVSADPPTILVSVGPNARVLPFLEPDGTFAVSLLAEGQRRIASDLADAFPVGPSPFPAEGPPVVAGAVVGLVCTVVRLVEVEGGGRLALGRVDEVVEGKGEPLLYHRRGYRPLG